VNVSGRDRRYLSAPDDGHDPIPTIEAVPPKWRRRLHGGTSLEVLLDLDRVLIVRSLDLLVKVRVAGIDVVDVGVVLEGTATAKVLALRDATHTREQHDRMVSYLALSRSRVGAIEAIRTSW